MIAWRRRKGGGRGAQILSCSTAFQEPTRPYRRKPRETAYTGSVGPPPNAATRLTHIARGPHQNLPNFVKGSAAVGACTYQSQVRRPSSSFHDDSEDATAQEPLTLQHHAGAAAGQVGMPWLEGCVCVCVLLLWSCVCVYASYGFRIETCVWSVSRALGGGFGMC
jgi:hypothetical protein